MSKFSFRSSDDIVGLFHRMFPDSLIAQKMSLGRDKMGYSIRFGLATYFNDQLMDLALKSPAYVICFDESLNKVTQEEQMDCYVRLYNVNKNRVETRYITSTFLGHATAVHLKDAFKENCKRLDPQKMLQISMDGPNVNLKFYSDLCAELEEQDDPQLVNIGTCSLHSVHNAFKSAVKVSDSGIDSLLQSLWTLFHNTPARRQDFTNITGGVTFPLKFCAHRWTENVNVIERALLVWPQVEKYVAHVNAPGNGKMKPSSLSFATVQKAVEDPLTTCALKFFLSIAVQLQPFLKKFQSDAPLLPLFPMIMGNMLLSIMARFLKHSVMESAQNNNWKALLKIDVSRTGNYRQLDEIDFGFGMKTSLEGVSILSTPSNVLQFKVSCRRSLVTLIEKLLNRNPLNNSFVRNLACLSPETILNDPATSAKYFERILWQLVRDKRFEEQKCDEALSQFRQLTSSQLTSFDVERDRLDDFYHNVLHEKKIYSTLYDVIKVLLTLSHGQASVERGFSINKQMLRENLSAETIIAMRQVK
jgi:hypothetical protein